MIDLMKDKLLTIAIVSVILAVCILGVGMGVTGADYSPNMMATGLTT